MQKMRQENSLTSLQLLVQTEMLCFDLLCFDASINAWGMGGWEAWQNWNFLCLHITDAAHQIPRKVFKLPMFFTYKALPGLAYWSVLVSQESFQIVRKYYNVWMINNVMNISVFTSIIGHNQSWCSRRASKALLLPVFASSASSQDPESAPPEHQIMDQNNLRDFTMLVLPCCFISTLLPSSVSAASCSSPWRCPRAAVCPPRSSLRVFSHSQGPGGSLAPESESVNVKVKVR